MKSSVSIIDDSFCEVACKEVTQEDRDAHFKTHKKVMPASVKFIPYHNQSGQMIVQPRKVRFTYEGKHLEHAVKRARRWLCGSRGRREGRVAPAHIQRFMLAYAKADPKGFSEDLNNGLA